LWTRLIQSAVSVVFARYATVEACLSVLKDGCCAASRKPLSCRSQRQVCSLPSRPCAVGLSCTQASSPAPARRRVSSAGRLAAQASSSCPFPGHVAVNVYRLQVRQGLDARTSTGDRKPARVQITHKPLVCCRCRARDRRCAAVGTIVPQAGMTYLRRLASAPRSSSAPSGTRRLLRSWGRHPGRQLTMCRRRSGLFISGRRAEAVK
jgi:hypothetical protein